MLVSWGALGKAMIFREYYRHRFNADLARFIVSIPAKSHNHDADMGGAFTIQYGNLTKDRPHLDVIDQDSRSNFALALFFTLLADEVCYTYFRSQYGPFQTLTQYPKFIGNCPSSCRTHFHPSHIFGAINYSRDPQNSEQRPNVHVEDTFDDATDVIRDELFDLFTNHLPAIDSSDFWIRCTNEFPYKTKHSKQVTK